MKQLSRAILTREFDNSARQLGGQKGAKTMGVLRNGESARRVTLAAAMILFALLFGTATALMAEVDPGREVEREYGGIWRNQAALERVRQIGDSLAAVADRRVDFEYQLLNNRELNAMALADGRVYVTRGFYERFTSNDELAGGLSHEQAHIIKRHHRRQAKKNLLGALLGAGAAAALGGDKDDIRTGAAVGAGLLGSYYSREDEYKADAYGMELVFRAGFSPFGLITLLEGIRARYGKGMADVPIIGLLASHPETGDRIGKGFKKIAQLFGHGITAEVVKTAYQRLGVNAITAFVDGGALALADEPAPSIRHSEPPNGGEESREESRDSRRGSFTPPNGKVQDDGEDRKAEAPAWEDDRDDTARGGDPRPGRSEPGRPRRSKQRIDLSVEDASSQRGSVRYGGGAIFFYGSPAETIPPVLERTVLETGRFVVSPDAPIEAVLAMTHYQMYKGLRGRTNLGSLLGSNVDVRHEQATAVLNAELRIETQEGIVWAVHLDATETGVLNDVEIRGGQWWSGQGGISVEWWKTPAGVATRRVCEQAAKQLTLLDFSNLQELSVFLVAAVRGDKVYVTTDGSLAVGDRLTVAGPAIFIDGEFLGYEEGSELEVVDATQPRLAVAKVVPGENGRAGPPDEGAPLFKKVSPRPERETGRRRY